MREEGLSSPRAMPFKMILSPLRSLDCTLRTMNGCEATQAPEARNLMVKVRGLGGLGLQSASCRELGWRHFLVLP